MECRLDRITVHYESIGEGRPLVVLPGWPDPWNIPADYLEPAFIDHPGWRRIYLDLPGRGETKGEPWITTNDQVLTIVLEVLDRLIPGERFAIAGHSAGAYLARAVVAERGADIDGLLQVVPVIDDGQPPPPSVTLVRDDGVASRISAEFGAEVARDLLENMVVQTPAVFARIKPLVPLMRTGDKAFLDQLDRRVNRHVDPLPARFDRPALFVLGRQDSMVGYRGVFDLMEDYPRATIAVLDRAGHGLPWEQPDLFGALVREWLMRVDEVSAT